ncbi:LLM class flavin-dependent oxidoreductase [Streptomyces sulphureus]|uniref:LLM class flavin-dependent oxidoreductase n=1 Tax=Streptomyces sulphureus TaxID=47758 RepID=UPI00035EB383|nr:LLM class flavin-dependent oxidoreductase [Streptomyces sulphureus]
MRAGITILPEYRWSEAVGKWQRAESYGFDHAWTFDHLGWRGLVDGPWFDAVPTLALAAAATSRIRLGPLVSTPNFRHPVTYARSLLTLDDVSRGRLLVGLGSGTPHGYDTTVLGPDSPSGARAARFREFVELLDALLTRDHVDYGGSHFTAVDARTLPGCVQQPRAPFVVAAIGPKAMDVAARFGDGWVTTGDPHDDLDAWWRSIADHRGRFEEALARQGRPDTVRRYLQTDGAPTYSLGSPETYREFLGRAAELGFTDVVAPWPRTSGVFAGDENVLDTVAADILPTLDRT